MHDNLLRELIQRHGGYEINTEGVAFDFCVYSTQKLCVCVGGRVGARGQVGLHAAGLVALAWSDFAVCAR